VSIFFIFLIGLFIGSFLNVLIDRLPKDLSILGRSHCEFCKHTLTIRDLIPLLSFIVLKGKCRYCHKELPYQYPFIELVTGIMFAITAFFIFGSSIFNFQFSILNELLIYVNLMKLFFYLIITSGLIVIFFADIKYYLIPDKITLVLGFVASIYLLLNPILIIPHLIASIIAFLFFLFVYMVTKGKGWGFGDVKFAFVMGLILGPIGTLIALYITFLTGAAVAIILILWKKKGLKSIIPFAPFLVIGTYISILFSNQIVRSVPFFQISIPVFPW